jgi:DNA-binding NarL/FixJ family response regulator
MTENTNDHARLLFIVVALLVAADLLTDLWIGGGAVHVVLELGAVVAAGAGAVSLWRRREQRLQGDVARARAEAERWRAEAAEALRGLGAAIDRQCDRWGLSPAEREITLLLLKGLALKEIASARGTSERTVRQQALAIYRKSGLAGRAELAAFFLEDLLLPPPPGASG